MPPARRFKRAPPPTEPRSMAVRKKSKGTARKAAKRQAPKARKATRRATRKRVASRKRTTAKLAAPAKFIDDSAAPRCRSRIPVEIDIAGRRERGAIADMSASGARIVGVKVDLPPGTPLDIRYASVTSPVLLQAEIVRLTDDGFAVKILPR
ncbi:MAG TPA: PilZ domain-containing protein [Myxococcota bacterium]|nr:PilZ domain-containing protein [Myxococcota bacterium]